MTNIAKVIELFPIPLYTAKIDLSISDINNIEKEDYEKMPSKNGSFSKEKYLLHNSKYENLKKEVMKHLGVYTKKYLNIQDDIKFYMQNSWSVKHDIGDWGQPHCHSNSLLSGVLYTKTNKDSGNINFLKPDGYTNLFHSSTNVPFDKIGIHNCKEYNIQPQIGDILLFPSHLLHAIEENKSNTDRYSVSFNFHIEGELMTKKSKIDYLKLKEFKYGG